MNELPLWAKILLVVILLLCSAFFSISETSMMSINRHRLNFLSQQGHKSAKRTKNVLEKTDDVLSLVLIGNNLINTLLTVLITSLAVYSFGDNQTVLSITTAIVSCLIIMFCEIIPKVIGASSAEFIAFKISLIIKYLLIIMKPFLLITNGTVNLLFNIFGINIDGKSAFSKQELKSIVLESSAFSLHHRNVLSNLFDLDHLSIKDVMTPKSKIEAINIHNSLEQIIEKIKNCYHSKLLVYDKNLDRPLGILHIRKTISYMQNGQINKDIIQNILTKPYYVPQHTSAIKQLQQFQHNQQRLGIVVDEYGEIKGLVTIEDILEQLIGEFTTSSNPKNTEYEKDSNGYYIIDASITLRELYLDLGLQFDAKKMSTLNGLLLNYLQYIPTSDISVKINNVIIEVIQVDEYGIKKVKLKPLSYN